MLNEQLKKQLRNKKYTRLYCFLALGLVVVLIGLFSSAFYLKSYNVSWQSTPFEQMESEKGVSASLFQRSGNGASWTKRPQTGEGYGREYKGMTIDAEIVNHGKFTIDDWVLRVDATEDYYINNAWNGTIEIHQFRNGVESVQTLDLSQTAYSDLTLQAMELEGDLLIEQMEGDYFIYHPSSIEVNLLPDGSVLIGFNIYRSGTFYFAPEFTSGELMYKRHANLTDLIAWNLFVILLIGWIILVINVLVMIYHDIKGDRDRERDVLMMDDIMGICGRCIEAKEMQLGISSKDRAYTAVAIAKKLGMGDEDARLLFYSTLLHNCGNLTLPDSLLTKDDSELTYDEKNLITTHTEEGYNMLKDVSSIPLAKDAAKYHHERWDGKGYPEGLKEDEIPKIARIVAIANTFEDVKSNAKKNGEISHVDFITAFTVKSGKELDPSMCKVVIDMIKNNEISVE